MSGFCETQLTSYSRITMNPRARVSLSRLVAGSFWTACCALSLGILAIEKAHAADPSDFVTEIITPSGWELVAAQRACWWEPETESVEIVTPKGWDDARSREVLTWSGYVCSDLVEPADWHRARAKATQRRARR